MIPGHLLARYHVVFDYPNGNFTLRAGRRLKAHRDRTADARVQKFRLSANRDGSGWSYPWVSSRYRSLVHDGLGVLLNSWGSKHPAWPRRQIREPTGEAATSAKQNIETMFVPGARWGSLTLGEFGVTSQYATALSRTT